MKRILSLVLALSMLTGMLPAAAIAEAEMLVDEPVVIEAPAVAEEPEAEEPVIEEPTPTPEPTEAPTPEPVEEPEVIAEEETEEAEEPVAVPEETEAPAEEETEETEEPVVAPEETEVPAEEETEETEEPVVTPEETEAPAEEETEAPEGTEEPVVTPEETEVPAEEETEAPTVTPEETPAVDELPEVEESVTPEETVVPEETPIVGEAELPELLATIVSVPQGLSAAGYNLEYCNVTWVAVSGATGYELQRSEDEDFADPVNYVLTGAGTTSKTLNDLVPGTEYFFRIRAYVTDADGTSRSLWSNVVSVRNLPGIPEKVRVEAQTGATAKITWNAVSGADGYVVNWNGEDDIELEGVSNTSLTVDGLELGVDYVVAVWAYCEIDDETTVSGEIDWQIYTHTPPAPKNVKTSTSTLSSIKVSWDEVEGVTGYRVYRSSNLGASADLVGEIPDGTENVFIDDVSIVAGQTYYYHVTAYYDTEYGTTLESPISEIVKGSATPAAPTGVTAVAGDGMITLTWDSVPYVAGYIVHSSSSKNFATYVETIFDAAEQLLYKDLGVGVGVGRYYRVCAYVGPTSSPIQGPWSTTAYDMVRPLPPSNITLTNTAYNAIAIDYDGAAGAAGYEIWQSTGSGYEKVRTTKYDTAYTFTGLTCGKTYSYKLRSYIKDTDGTTLYGEYSNSVSLMAKPPKPASVYAYPVSGKDQMEIVWDAVPGASGYYIYANENNTSDQLIATVEPEELSYIAEDLHPGSEYVFSVCAYRLVSSKEIAGELGKSASTYLTVPPVTNLKATPDTMESVKLTWTAAAGAEGYIVRVYEGTVADSDKLFKTMTTTSKSAVVEELVVGYDYLCVVNAYTKVGSVTKESAVSASIVANVMPDTPTSFTVSANPNGYGAKITWKNVDGADGYRIQRSTKAGSGFTSLVILDGETDGSGSTTYTYIDDVDASKAGTTYYYRVASYVDALGERHYSPNTSAKSNRVVASAPKNLKVSAATLTSVTFKWDAVSGATGYNIYLAEKSSGPYSNIGTAAGASYTVTGLTVGKTYYVKVRATNVSGSMTVLGAASSGLAISPAPAAPTGLTFVRHAKSMTLSWNAVSGASGYAIYYAKGNGAYTLKGYTDKLTYDVTGLDAKQTYNFRVYSYRSAGNRVLSLDYASVKASTQVEKVLNLKSESKNSTTLTLTWDKVIDAEGYEISRATSYSGTYTKIAETTKQTYDVQNLETGTTFYYRVRAYVTKNGSRIYGYSATNYNKTIPLAPTELKLKSRTSSSITVTWKAADNADGYKVFCRKYAQGSYQLVTMLVGEDVTEYRIDGLDPGKKYQIIIRSVCQNPNGKYINGDASTALVVDTLK